MNAQQLITWLVVGLIAGWLAHLIVGGPANMLGYLVAGLLGGFVGSWVFNALGWNLNLGNAIVEAIVTSAIGAAIVILLAKLLHVLA
ncbi:MAG: GlsB/YeaQ/YmgE family stress response membrane protein [Hyphomicrobiaceae bacterium]|nr:GlsB/YeaQ/YmgE family stress response membrane protein [Hyphomicrobiaceae bacterium]